MHSMERYQDMPSGMVIFSFYGLWYGPDVHLIPLVNTAQLFLGLNRLRRALSLITTFAWHVSAFQVCVLACLGRRGSRLVGCVRRFRPPPPPLVGFWPVVLPLFCSLAFSGFRPLRARGVVLVFLFFSFFFCVSLLGLRL